MHIYSGNQCIYWNFIQIRIIPHSGFRFQYIAWSIRTAWFCLALLWLYIIVYSWFSSICLPILFRDASLAPCPNVIEISVKDSGKKTQNMAKHGHNSWDVSQHQHCSYDGRGYPVLEPFCDDSSGSTKFGSPEFVALNRCRTWFTKSLRWFDEYVRIILSNRLYGCVLKKSCKHSQVEKNSFKTNDTRLCLWFLLNLFGDKTFAIIY